MPWMCDLCFGQPLAKYCVFGWCGLGTVYLSSLHFYTCDTCASDNPELGSPGPQQKGGGCRTAVYHKRTQAHTFLFHSLLWDNVHEPYLGSPLLPVAWVMSTLQQYASKSPDPGVLSVKGTGALSPSLVLPMKSSTVLGTDEVLGQPLRPQDLRPLLCPGYSQNWE